MLYSKPATGYISWREKAPTTIFWLTPQGVYVIGVDSHNVTIYSNAVCCLAACQTNPQKHC